MKHDRAVEERLKLIEHCFNKTVHSVILPVPDLEELYEFKKCMRKHLRVEMRVVNYYRTLHEPSLKNTIHDFGVFLRDKKKVN
jgi:hypothetical protein